MSRELSVVIVTYNSAEEIETCVRTIERANGVEVVVVDNASVDGTRSLLRMLEHQGLVTRSILRDRNGGFAVAVNEAMRVVPPSHDVLLLNPDAYLAPGALAGLRAAASKYLRSGILSPLVRSATTIKTTTAGRQPTFWPMFFHFSGLSRLFRRTRLFRGRYLYLDSPLSETENVEWVAGCAMYIRHELRTQLPELSEQWFMYAEDTEYCDRARRVGFEVIVLPRLECFHTMGVSVRQSKSDTVNLMWPRSLTDYYRTQFTPSGPTFLGWRLVFSVGLLSRAMVLWLRSIRTHDINARQESFRFRAFARAVWQPQ